jgi:hypothetical protein
MESKFALSDIFSTWFYAWSFSNSYKFEWILIFHTYFLISIFEGTPW